MSFVKIEVVVAVAGRKQVRAAETRNVIARNAMKSNETASSAKQTGKQTAKRQKH